MKWTPQHRPIPVSLVVEMWTASVMYEMHPHMPLAQDKQTDLAVGFRLAFMSMLNGYASEENWAVCVCSLNIALVLAEWGYGEDYIPQLNAALEGAFRSKVRAGRTGKWGFDGPAITAIEFAFEVHEEQIKAVPQHIVPKALAEVHKRADEGNVFMEAA